MYLLADSVTALILLLHGYIVLLETVLFNTRGRRVFGLSAEKAAIVKPLMSNQGCYNGFLVAALLIGFMHPDGGVARAFTLFGLCCIAVAGVWGGATVKKSILFIQTAPALFALLLYHFA